MQKATIRLFNKSLVITSVLAMTTSVYANPSNEPQAKTFQGNEYAGAKTFQPQNQPQAIPTQTNNSQNQQQSNVSYDTKAYLVKMLEGQESLLPITADIQLQTGDVLAYKTTVHNNSSDRIESMQVTLSIPQEVVLIGNTSPEYVLASLNERDFYPAPLQTQRNGVMENIALSNYKGLRWTVKNLGLAESTTVSYRAKMK
ncbi:MAG: hypothetical protein KGV51_02845 [Moraxellaceae bacterium]|nr:hypothetical protein [Moraxellaceae bacterium]